MNNQDVAKFFHDTETNIYGNSALRDPQREAYQEIFKHFETSSDPCYVQLPVGCGKSGLIGLTPFGVATGRVLIVVPNLNVRQTIYRELNISDPNCFYSKRGVLAPPLSGPFVTELKAGANAHDCDNAHIILANVQQFGGDNNKWYELFGRDYFHMILVDEGHHNVADTWRRLFEYFADARVVSYTATPVRSDGQKVLGERVYRFGYARSMMMGYISPIDAVYVAPSIISFSAEGQTQTLTLEEVLKMREKDWFSKGIASSEECNRHIVEASIRQLNQVRQHGSPRQIIATTCSIRHAKQVAGLYHEYGLNAEVLHSELTIDERDRVEGALRSGLIDVVVQVQMLGEGYDLGTLSVAAVFRPYRSLSPYIQFVGRILRLADPLTPHSPGNRVYLVSHIGLNDERWWTDFSNFDKDDQEFFSEYLGGPDETIEGEGGPRVTLRPFMRVLNETVDQYVQKGFLRLVDQTMVDEVLQTIRSKGFDPIEFGLTEEMMRQRLELAVQAERHVLAYALPVQPQKRKEALRVRLTQEARSIADTVVNRLGLKHGGRDLLKHFPGRGESNVVILINLAQGAQNKVMNASPGERDKASSEQFEAALKASADIVDSLTAAVGSKLRG
jgi:DNA repair protein RadD